MTYSHTATIEGRTRRIYFTRDEREAKSFAKKFEYMGSYAYRFMDDLYRVII